MGLTYITGAISGPAGTAIEILGLHPFNRTLPPARMLLA
jgi:hypothetical protein